MPYTEEELKKIHRRTRGKCHLCHKRRTFANYGKPEKERGWEVEHSNARANGGTDHMNNLFVACTGGNRSKCTRSTASCRRKNGLRRAPMSRDRMANEKTKNGWSGAAIGGIIGLIGGPFGVLAGISIGGYVGHSIDPEAD